MNKFILAVLGIVVIAAASTAGLFDLKLDNDKVQVIDTAARCLDYDPPNTSDSVIFGGKNYFLIKQDATITKAKMGEMDKVGEYNGSELYQLRTTNYFGQQVDKTILYKLKEIKQEKDGEDYIFDVYIQEGVEIPEYARKCQSTGGVLEIVQDDASFPPYGFNKTQINGLTDQNIASAFIYDGNQTTKSAILGLSGIKRLGTLTPPGSSDSYELQLHLDTVYLISGADAYEYIPTDEIINPQAAGQGQKTLQLKPVKIVTKRNYSWFTPSCKPAIYLYPTQKQNVNVKVNTTGKFTLTIPSYPQNGWNAVAYPNGNIFVDGRNYPYLYYESEIPHDLVKKPENGYVVVRKDLPKLFDNLLPKLGLRGSEIIEFKEYWEKVLPESPYYFVGVMEQQDIDRIEPLDINPNPDISIRVRLYFELLDKKIEVEKPDIVTPLRKGFTMVEWGGMVKTDTNNPFVCSQ